VAAASSSSEPHLSGKAGQGVTGLFYGDTSQFLTQVMGAAICAAWAFGATFIVFKVVNAVKSMRIERG
jgi:Amt family ammonium transporter